MSSESRDRRAFLKKLAAAAYAAPLFVTVGARGADQSAFERAKQYLSNARSKISQGKAASSAASRREWAMEASLELTQARASANKAPPSERNKLKGDFRKVANDIAALKRGG